jgi:predicted transcriptional regulator
VAGEEFVELDEVEVVDERTVAAVVCVISTASEIMEVIAVDARRPKTELSAMIRKVENSTKVCLRRETRKGRRRPHESSTTATTVCQLPLT